MAEQDYETTQLIVDNVVLNGAHEYYTDASAVNKLYVDNKTSDEKKERTDADDALSVRITSEVGDRTTADDSLSTRIDGLTMSLENETQARSQEDVSLSGRIDGLTMSLENETQARSQEDVNQSVRIDGLTMSLENETQARSQEDVLLTTNINNEVSRATAAETYLQSEVDNLSNVKLNKQDPVVLGDLSLSEPHYIYFGDNWRVKSQANRMQFEYSRPNSGVFKVALPIICPSF